MHKKFPCDFECCSCGVKFTLTPQATHPYRAWGPTNCKSCGYLWVKCTNYEEWVRINKK